MKIKKIAALFLAALMTLCGCAADGGIKVRSLDLKEKNFKTLGRAYYSDGGIYCALSGTGVEFIFSGTACSVTVTGDSNSSNPSMADNHARIAIYVNGERVIDDMIDSAVKTFDVFESDVEEEVTVRIIKLSESAMSTYCISDITVTGGNVRPAPESDVLIEFVGDSITCGYGVDDEDRDHHFSTKTEDVTKTYAFKTAEALGADWSMVSYSGYGIISGFTNGDVKISEQTVPQYYEKYGYTWSENPDFKPSEKEWKFSRKPDAVVINLGTNDDSYCKNIPERCSEYQKEYVSLLKTVRKRNPDALILCVLGMMGQNLYPYVEAAVSEYSAETGDKNVYSLMLDDREASDGFAADWHPTEATHSKAAEKLTAELKTLLGA